MVANDSHNIHAENAVNGAQSDIVQELHFRNYVPEDENLKALLLPYKPLELARNIADEVVNKANSIIQKFRDRYPLDRLRDDVDIIQQLKPRKVNFDLKRNVESKLKFLERRTQKAIAELRESEESEEDNSSEEDESRSDESDS